MKRLLTGCTFAALFALSSAAYAQSPTCELDWYNYEPMGTDGDWGVQAPTGLPPEDPNLPPVQVNTIESIKFEENPALNGGFLFIPPDPHCAVGPNHIVTIVNCAIQWYPKAGGAPQNQQPLGKQVATITNAFFNSLTPVNGLFDPKVLYDQYNDRFVVVALEQVGGATATSRALLAVSDDSDPNGVWFFQAMNSEIVISGAEAWLDYPGFAVDQNVIYLTGNYFNYPLTIGYGSRQWIINKAPFYAGGALSLNAGSPFDAAAATGFPNSTMMPTHMFGVPPANVGTWFVLYSGLSDGTNEYLQTIRVDNPTGVVSFFADQAFLGNIDALGTLPQGAQPGSTAQLATQINTGDRRCLQALWRNNSLYAVFHVNPPLPSADNGQCTSHWVKLGITAGVGALQDQGDVGGNAVTPVAWTNYPSIAVDKLGNMAMCFGLGSSTTFASAAYTTRSAADPAGFTNTPVVYANGMAFYKRTFSSSTTARNRWGDYTGTVVDPDGCIFWSYNEYAGSQGTPTTVGGVTENGRWWTRAVSYYVDDNGNGVPDACQPVAVVLSKFEVVRDGSDAVLRWSVAEEHDHLGFNVFRESEGGARVILHEGLLTGAVDYEFRDEDVPASAATYWLQEVDRNGKSTWLGTITLEPASDKPMVAQIYGASPNPFSRATTVSYSLGTTGHVNVAVFDLQGRKVATLVDGSQNAGSHTASWNGESDNGSTITSGFYFIKLQTAGQIKNTKVVLTKAGVDFGSK